MTPTFAQRLWLRPARLEPEERRRLLAARAAAILFAVQPTLALAAAAASGSVARAGFVAAGFSYALAALVLFGYEHLPQAAKALLAAGGALAISTFVLAQPNGEIYSLLHVGLIFYVCFYFTPRRAIVQIAFIVSAVATAAALSAPSLRSAAEFALLNAGAFAGAATITIVLRRRLLAALAKAEDAGATLDAFFLHAPDGFGFLDVDLRHVHVNHALAEIMGAEREEIVGRTLRELAPINAHLLEPLALHAIESGEPVLGIEIESAEGRCHLVSYYPIPAAVGMAGVGTAVTDVTHLKDVERRLEDTNRKLTVLATTDELTGLPNRRLLGEQLDLALARARRGGLGVALLCLDLDNFKHVNDTLGHGYGDDLLAEIARRLRAGARETDVVARVGGDEFVILLADLDVQEAPELAEGVARRVHEVLAAPMAIGAVELRAEASVGIATYPLDSGDAKGLMAAADAAMYVGKSAFTRVA